MPGTHTLVLGAGFGGLTVATEVARRAPPGHTVTLVDRNDSYFMGLAKLHVMDGRRGPREGERRLQDVERAGVRFLQGEAKALDLVARTANVGREVLRWDHLVLALGAELAPEAVPGLHGAKSAHNLYSRQGAEALHRDLAAFPGGDVLVLVAAMPFKCPPAPYEAALLMRAYLAARGVEARVTIATPEPHPMPISGPEFGGRVKRLVEERGVAVLNGLTVKEVDAAAGVVRFTDGTERRYDLLAVVPPHRAPALLREAGLVDASGWVPVDAGTLATAHPGVWAVGDCTVLKVPNGKPLPKAGVLAEGEGAAVAENLLARIRGEPETARFPGLGVCYLELGNGEAMEARGDFLGPGGPAFAAEPPSREALAAKHRFEAERLARWFGS